MNEPHEETTAPDREATLTNEEIETRAVGDGQGPRPMAQDDTGDTGDDTGDTTDTSDTGDDSGDVSDTGDDSGDSGDDSGA